MDPVQAISSIRKFVSSDLTYGILNAEQAKQFYVQAFDQLEFSKLHRKETKRAKTGELDKLGIGTRLLRAKTEGPDGDDGYRVAPTTGQVPYTCVRIKLPWEMSEEAIHDNIEGEGLETKFMGMLTTQLGIDMEDLHWNADTADASGDADFLTLNDGWLKQLVAGAHVVDASGEGFESTMIGKDKMFAAVRAMPTKYLSNPRMCWMMSKITEYAWIEYVSSRATGAGDLALLGSAAQTPLGYPIVHVPSMADGTVVFSDPMNFIAVNTWDVRIRKTSEGKSAVMNDMRYGSVFLDDDPVIEELDAAVIVSNMTIE
ncbi:MAG: phage major capsid protein [Thermoleophilia bacterium]|nr:phage major capsid protein [Thermoleophilia bacterium]